MEVTSEAKQRFNFNSGIGNVFVFGLEYKLCPAKNPLC